MFFFFFRFFRVNSLSVSFSTCVPCFSTAFYLSVLLIAQLTSKAWMQANMSESLIYFYSLFLQLYVKTKTSSASPFPSVFALAVFFSQSVSKTSNELVDKSLKSELRSTAKGAKWNHQMEMCDGKSWRPLWFYFAVSGHHRHTSALLLFSFTCKLVTKNQKVVATLSFLHFFSRVSFGPE